MSGNILNKKTITSFSLILFLIVTTPNYLLSDDTKECEVIKINKLFFIKFCNDGEIDAFEKYRKSQCQKVDDKEIEIRQANVNVYFNHTKVCICKKNEIGDKCKAWLQETKSPPQIELVFKKFCEDSKTTQDLSETVPWLQREYFCQVAYVTSHPDTVIASFVNDFPSMKRLQEKADRLCEDVRNNKITIPEAYYQWTQERIIFSKDFDSDNLYYSAKTGLKAGKLMFGIFKDFLIP